MSAVLTTYDEQHLVTYWRLLDAEAAVPSGRKWLESCCISIRIANRARSQCI